MPSRAIVFACLLVLGTTAVFAVPAAADGPGGPRIVEVYPNPVAENNVGEYVVVEFPSPTNTTGWALTDDGREQAHLPNETLEGRVAFSLDPGHARNHTDETVLELTGWLRPAASGDRIELRQDGVVVDAVTYDRASEGERWLRADGGQWVPLGATDHDVVTSSPDSVQPFVLPDGRSQPEAFLRSAEDRLLVAGYTFTSEQAVDALLDAHERGVDVRVLVDGTPVGGITDRQARALDRLVAADVEVTALAGDHARYRFHHAKYAVGDDRALVTTENWKPSGTGGRGSRGWGIVLDDPAAAEELAGVFEADVTWRAGIAWETYRTTVEPVEDDPADGSYPERFEPERLDVEAARVLVAPDNAERELRSLLEGAEESIRIQQVSVGGTDSTLVAATIDAARRGVDIELQLSTAWYVEEENREVAAELERLADNEGLSISVELVDPRSRFRSVHTKGVVVDDRHVVLGSINWNDHSLRENREVAVLVTGEDVAEYYGDVLTADRRGGVWRLPIGFGVALLLGVLVAGAACWRTISWRPRCRSSCSPGSDRSQRRPSSRPVRPGLPPDDP